VRITDNKNYIRNIHTYTSYLLTYLTEFSEIDQRKTKNYFEWNSSKPGKEHAVLCSQAVVDVSQTDVRNYLQRCSKLEHWKFHYGS